MYRTSPENKNMDIGVVILTCNAVFFYSFLLGVVAGIKAAKSR